MLVMYLPLLKSTKYLTFMLISLALVSTRITISYWQIIDLIAILRSLVHWKYFCFSRIELPLMLPCVNDLIKLYGIQKRDPMQDLARLKFFCNNMFHECNE